MKSKTAFWDFRNIFFKYFLLLFLLFSGFVAVGQPFPNAIFVDKVFPTRVTTGSKIKILKGGVGIPGFESLTIGSIYTIPGGGWFLNETRTVATITINNTSAIDIGPSPLIIRKKNENQVSTDYTVHTGSPATAENQVLITYVAPQLKELVQNSSYLVNEIFTTWDYNDRGFWSSEDGMQPGGAVEGLASPDDYHELLGYRVGFWPGNGSVRTRKPTGIIYSTGVDDELLEQKLETYYGFTLDSFANPDKYKRQVFKAYSNFGISGQLISDPDIGKNAYLLAADRIEKDPLTGDPLVGNDESNTDNISTFSDINGLRVFDAITNGRNGLELGTAVANFNKNLEVKFYSGNGSEGAVGDDTPDLLITQMALPDGYDIYYYTDSDGNVIGRPIKLYISNAGFRTRLGFWNTDSYSYPYPGDFAWSTPNNRAFVSTEPQYKPIWMVAFKLEDFEIQTLQQVEKIESVVMNSDGSADIAFLAYNRSSFKIKGPIVKPLLTKYICKTDESYTVNFVLTPGTTVGIDDGNGEISFPDSSDPLKYQWLKNNIPIVGATSSSLTITGSDDSSLGTYKVRIGNKKGNIIMQVDLLEGGYPFTWNGSDWDLAPIYANAGFVVANKDRSLIFNSPSPDPIEVTGILEGCDCFIANETNVIVKGGQTLKLHGAINVASEVEASEGVEARSAGTFTLENNASLIQTKDVTENQNYGSISVKRIAENLKKYDYIYWSSPVEGGNMDMVSGATQHVYEWNTNADNDGSTVKGNWVKFDGNDMQIGRGYIKRFNSTGLVNSEFFGKPNNGTISVDVFRTTSVNPGPEEVDSNAHLNLLGNPYPSAIFADTFLEENKSLEGWVQVWTHSEDLIETGLDKEDPFYGDFKYNYGDQYVTYNLLGATPPNKNNMEDGIIKSGQGFFVKVDNKTIDAVSEVLFKNNMRYDVAHPNGYDNAGFFRNSKENSEHREDKELVWLSLINEQLTSSTTLLGYVDGATYGKDRLYDVVSRSKDMRIYSVIDEADLLIQGRPLPLENTDIVPLGYNVLKSGIYKIGIDKLKGTQMLDDAQPIYLEDTYNNIIHNLKIAPYSFTASVGECKDRFVLRYANNVLSADDNKLSNTFVYIKNNELFIKASNIIESVHVYDLTGKKLLEHQLDVNIEEFSAPFQYAKGAYITMINFNNGSTISKKIIN